MHRASQQERREEKRREARARTQPATPARILIVDDPLDGLDSLRRVLEGRRHEVFLAASVAEAVAVLDNQPIDLLITDLAIPETGGLDLAHHVRDNFENTAVVVTTGQPTVETAFTAGRMRAQAYVKRPFAPDELLAVVDRALENVRRQHLADPMSSCETPPATWGMIGDSPAMQDVYVRIRDFAPSPESVLILGETGTGKELAANAMHVESGRSGPLVAINCAGMPSELLESELFGYLKGAFTGADRDKKGLFVAADGGILLLDEIGEMPLELQPKLLRVLENGRVRPVGSTEEIVVNVRILASTNRNLEQAVAEGRFREDLFYRLNVLTVRLPPLRERENDLLLLLRHFVEEKAAGLRRSPPRCTPAARAAILAHPWKGNVRALENLMSRLLATCHGNTIDVTDLPRSLRFTAATEGERLVTLEEKAREYCRYVFAKVRRNTSRAAKILDIDPKTLRRKLSLDASRDPKART